MTPEQQKCLAFVRSYIAEHEHSPSYEEIGEHLGRVKSTVHRLVLGLEREGHIVRRDYGNRSIQVAARPRPRAEDVLNAIVLAHSFDDGEGHMIACTPEELLPTLRAALA